MKRHCIRLDLLILLIMGLAVIPAPALAAKQGWSLNVGYHNPPNSTLGVNFLKFWSNLALEFGIGQLAFNSGSDNGKQGNSDNTSRLSFSGDVNLKYLFGNSPIRPYVQGGLQTGAGVSAGESTAVTASGTTPFGGGGLFLMGDSLYGYGSYNSTDRGDTFWQAGVGIQF